MKRLLIRLRCWLLLHDFHWEHPALVCRRCGHREENGLLWICKTLFKE